MLKFVFHCYQKHRVELFLRRLFSATAVGSSYGLFPLSKYRRSYQLQPADRLAHVTGLQLVNVFPARILSCLDIPSSDTPVFCLRFCPHPAPRGAASTPAAASSSRGGALFKERLCQRATTATPITVESAREGHVFSLFLAQGRWRAQRQELTQV